MDAPQSADDKTTSPAVEETPKVEETKPATESTEPVASVTNGEPVDTHKTEAPEATSAESAKLSEELASVVAEPTSEEVKPKESIEEKPVASVPEPVAEPTPTPAIVEEASKVEEPTKEVRTEEVPPPLPSSNPPSPVTVFAESTKAEAALTSGQVPLEETKEVQEGPKPEECALPESPVISEPSQDQPLAADPLPPSPPSQIEETPSIADPLPPSPPSPLPQIETKVPDPSPSIEDLPPAPPSPVPENDIAPSTEATNLIDEQTEKTETKPPAEPIVLPETTPADKTSFQADPSTPPPTPAASTEVSSSELPLNASSPPSHHSDISEPVAPADSLPDISTESLPSLPEPVSESLAPMSLPPVDSVPEPIVPSDNKEVPLTNGNVIGHGSPSPIEEAVLESQMSGSTKQITPEAVKESEISPEGGDKPNEIAVATVEE